MNRKETENQSKLIHAQSKELTGTPKKAREFFVKDGGVHPNYVEADRLQEGRNKLPFYTYAAQQPAEQTAYFESIEPEKLAETDQQPKETKPPIEYTTTKLFKQIKYHRHQKSKVQRFHLSTFTGSIFTVVFLPTLPVTKAFYDSRSKTLFISGNPTLLASKTYLETHFIDFLFFELQHTDFLSVSKSIHQLESKYLVETSRLSHYKFSYEQITSLLPTTRFTDSVLTELLLTHYPVEGPYLLDFNSVLHNVLSNTDLTVSPTWQTVKGKFPNIDEVATLLIYAIHKIIDSILSPDY